MALHSAKEDIYLNIITSPDKDLQSKKSILEFQKKLENLNKVSNERFKFLTKYNLTTELNLNGIDLTTAIAGGAVFDFYTSGMTIPIGTIVSAAASVLRIKANRTTNVEKAENNLKLSYLSEASKNKIV